MNKKRIEKLAAQLLPENYDLFKKMTVKQAYANKRDDINAVALWRLVFSSAIKQAVSEKGEIINCCWHLFNTLCMYESGVIDMTPEDAEIHRKEEHRAMIEYLKNQPETPESEQDDQIPF